MNFAADQVDLWWPAAAPCRRRQQSVVRRVEVRARWRGDDYPPRAEVGPLSRRRAGDGCCGHAPAGTVEVRLHRAQAESVREQRGRLAGAGRRRGRREYDEVLIAVGHQDTSAAALGAGRTHAAPLVPAVFPVDAGSRATGPGARSRSAASRSRSSTRTGAHRGPRRLVEPLDHPLPAALRAGGGRRRADPAVHAHRPARCSRSRARQSPRGRRTLERIAAEGRTAADGARTPARLERDVEPILAAVAAASLDSAIAHRAPGPNCAGRAGNGTFGSPSRSRDRDHRWARPRVYGRRRGGDRRSLAVGAGLAATGSGLGARARLAGPLSGGGRAARRRRARERRDWPAFRA